jgi:hypothetical protein
MSPKGGNEKMLRTYTVHLTNKGNLSTGTVSAKNSKEAMNNAKSKYKYSEFKVLSVSLKN